MKKHQLKPKLMSDKQYKYNLLQYQDIESNEKTYAQEEANRNKAHETWVRKNSEHDDAIAAVDEATKLVQHLSLGATFAELKPKFEAV